ncbi:RidA family protein [Peptoniphilus porci]|uniref:Reactive intermediate/imine deaminase n=1 Tax=Peptoniphilus porci TaxID=2652280 RepID=A0A1U7LY54_9FIRM|nr:RidA family protein [Peptoniphilus porci]OLR64350.1 reactive intermediate/imine deaminase [Peptoniphilus porci]
MKKIETEYSVRDGGHYTPGMIHNGTLYISGQLSHNPKTGKKPEGIKAQTKQALLNLELVLKNAGCTKNDVLFCRVYIPDVKLWGDLNEVYAEFFENHKPSRVVVPSNNLYDDCLVEIEAIAQVKE